jgi:manganese oxidase
MNIKFNWLAVNGKAVPERVGIGMIDLGMDHHLVHLHGFTFWETGCGGARQFDAI